MVTTYVKNSTEIFQGWIQETEEPVCSLKSTQNTWLNFFVLFMSF